MAPKTAKAVKTKTRLAKLQAAGLPNSYTSLFYGFLTVVIFFLIVFFGVKVFSQNGKKGQISNGAQTSAESQIKELSKVHVVKAGESLWGIAEQYYKSGYNWVDIANANKLSEPSVITSGTKLVIPTVQPKQLTVVTLAQNTQEAVSQADKITGGSYTVQEGDSLWAVSVRAYGDGYKWTEVANANKLENPDVIHPGNLLKLPR